MAKKTKSISLQQVIADTVNDAFMGEPPIEESDKIATAQYHFTLSVFENILTKIAQGNTVNITCFGKFSARVLPETVRNPKTNEMQQPCGRMRLRFKASDDTIRRLNNTEE